MNSYIVSRYWSMYDQVEVNAESPEEAVEKAHAMPILNQNADYVPDSINTSTDTGVRVLVDGKYQLIEYDDSQIDSWMQ